MRHVLGMHEVLHVMIVVGKKCLPEMVETVQLVLCIEMSDILLTSCFELWRSSNSRSKVQINKVDILLRFVMVEWCVFNVFFSDSKWG